MTFSLKKNYRWSFRETGRVGGSLHFGKVTGFFYVSLVWSVTAVFSFEMLLSFLYFWLTFSCSKVTYFDSFLFYWRRNKQIFVPKLFWLLCFSRSLSRQNEFILKTVTSKNHCWDICSKVFCQRKKWFFWAKPPVSKFLFYFFCEVFELHFWILFPKNFFFFENVTPLCQIWYFYFLFHSHHFMSTDTKNEPPCQTTSDVFVLETLLSQIVTFYFTSEFSRQCVHFVNSTLITIWEVYNTEKSPLDELPKSYHDFRFWKKY